jgi:hypothetical protein
MIISNEQQWSKPADGQARRGFGSAKSHLIVPNRILNFSTPTEWTQEARLLPALMLRRIWNWEIRQNQGQSR